jgi:EAL domain-containing protein (putative c-di-GMP-specific phosphodiesterase class I)/CheY-like chemotaxis protein
MIARHDVVHGSRIRVAIADDDAAFRGALADLIQAEPAFELVGQATDAHQAISICRSLRPDVILVDLKMPGRGGEYAIDEIRKLEGATRCIALTAYEDRGSILRTIRAGAQAYLVKGVPASEILATIAHVHEGESLLSSEVAATVVHELATKLSNEERNTGQRHAAIAQIQGTIRRNSIRIAFQPIRHLADRRVIGYEALSRFTPPDVRTTAEWFGLAREVGLLQDLEFAAVEGALKQIGQIPAGALLSVNLSPQSIQDERFTELLKSCPADRLIVEITEHLAVENYKSLMQSLASYRREGGKLAVDDAGSGYSSLQHIIELEPDMIKLDGSLCREVVLQVKQRAVTSSLVALGEATGSLVIAEGIESQPQLDTLLQLGVQYGQGYHLGQPGALETSS